MRDKNDLSKGKMHNIPEFWGVALGSFIFWFCQFKSSGSLNLVTFNDFDVQIVFKGSVYRTKKRPLTGPAVTVKDWSLAVKVKVFQIWNTSLTTKRLV